MPGNVAKILPITIVGVMLVMAPMTLAQPGNPDGAPPLDFFLSDDDTDVAKVMYKEDADVGSGLVSLSPSQSCQLWHADEAAEVDLLFADVTGDEVEYNLDTLLLSGVNEITVSVGPIAADGTYQATASSTGLSGTFNLGEDLAVETGGYLGFRVCAVFATGTSGTVDITTDGSSWVSMTDAPPPTYPTPELGSLLLSGLGLVAIVGVNRLRRR